jgi:hypothetical protein
MSEPFLLTGLPRIRSAWFTALFNAIQVPCIHEWGYSFNYVKSAFHRWVNLHGYRGVCDPSIAVANEQTENIELFAGRPVVIIDRAPVDAQIAFEDWIGQPAPNYGALIRNLWAFEHAAKEAKCDIMKVSYHTLDSYDVVADVVKHCCRQPLPHRIWRQFHVLHVEQHLTKVALARQLAGYSP